ncbi:MAG TPA: AIR synthase-related protein, partial [Thermosynechococcaceae cyanobacterium]
LDSNGIPQPIYPTPVVGMVGRISDLTKISSQGWQSEGDLIYLLGLPLEQNSRSVTLGGSEYLATIHGTIAGQPPAIDFNLERQVQAACREGIQRGWVRSAHDSAEGGIAVALAESCISGDRGAEIRLQVPSSPSPPLRWDLLLFGEGGARILVTIAPDQKAEWEAYLNQALSNSWQHLGVVSARTLRVLTADQQPLIEVAVSELSDRWLNAIERQLQQ